MSRKLSHFLFIEMEKDESCQLNRLFVCVLYRILLYIVHFTLTLHFNQNTKSLLEVITSTPPFFGLRVCASLNMCVRLIFFFSFFKKIIVKWLSIQKTKRWAIILKPNQFYLFYFSFGVLYLRYSSESLFFFRHESIITRLMTRVLTPPPLHVYICKREIRFPSTAFLFFFISVTHRKRNKNNKIREGRANKTTFLGNVCLFCFLTFLKTK